MPSRFSSRFTRARVGPRDSIHFFFHPTKLSNLSKRVSPRSKRSRFGDRGLSTCRRCVTLYRVNLEGFSLRSTRGLFFVCLFLHVVISMISFFFLLLGCSKFRPNFDAIGKNAVSREKESFIKRSIGQFKNLESNLDR